MQLTIRKSMSILYEADKKRKKRMNWSLIIGVCLGVTIMYLWGKIIVELQYRRM